MVPICRLSPISILAVAQLVHVQQYLQNAGIEAVVGPPLNIGITNEAGDWMREEPTCTLVVSTSAPKVCEVISGPSALSA